MWLRKPVPGANLLADVTSEKPVVEFTFQGGRKARLFQFDGEIGNAFAPIYSRAGKDRLRRTSIDATGTRATMIGGEWGIWLQIQIRNQGSDE